MLISFSGRTKQIFFLVIKLEPRLLSWLQPWKNNCVPTELDVSISAYVWNCAIFHLIVWGNWKHIEIIWRGERIGHNGELIYGSIKCTTKWRLIDGWDWPNLVTLICYSQPQIAQCCSAINWKLIIKFIMSGNFFHYQFLLHLTVLENKLLRRNVVQVCFKLQKHFSKFVLTTLYLSKLV